VRPPSRPGGQDRHGGWAIPFTTWSLRKLVEHLRARHRIVISTETVQVILGEVGINWQATKTWKGSRDGVGYMFQRA